MLLGKYYDGIELHREKRVLYARFLVPHVVLSTCRAAGGLQAGLDCLLNHQSCEPSGHKKGLPASIFNDPAAYRRLVCQQAGLESEACATLGTAANMHNACIRAETFRDLTVVAVCTAGVETNAGRVGDPAAVVETENGFEKTGSNKGRQRTDAELSKATGVATDSGSRRREHRATRRTGSTPQSQRGDAQQRARTCRHAGEGTINTMLFISRPLTPGALVRTVVTATEAKTAALQELAVNSRYSDGPATGTGTDQIGVAAVKDDGRRPLTGAGKHVKLGELIGRSVLAAVKGALALQNGLTPAGQCSAKIHLERLGCNRRQMTETVAGFLEKDKAALLRQNFTAIERDPVTVAAVAAMVHLRDKFAWQILPPSCWSEVMGSYAAQVACAVCGDYGKMEDFRRQLAPLPEENANQDFVRLVCRAMAIGFDAKWGKIE